MHLEAIFERQSVAHFKVANKDINAAATGFVDENLALFAVEQVKVTVASIAHAVEEGFQLAAFGFMSNEVDIGVGALEGLAAQRAVMVNGQTANSAQVDVLGAGGFHQAVHFLGDFGFNQFHRPPNDETEKSASHQAKQDVPQ